MGCCIGNPKVRPGGSISQQTTFQAGIVSGDETSNQTSKIEIDRTFSHNKNVMHHPSHRVQSVPEVEEMVSKSITFGQEPLESDNRPFKQSIMTINEEEEQSVQISKHHPGFGDNNSNMSFQKTETNKSGEQTPVSEQPTTLQNFIESFGSPVKSIVRNEKHKKTNSFSNMEWQSDRKQLINKQSRGYYLPFKIEEHEIEESRMSQHDKNISLNRSSSVKNNELNNEIISVNPKPRSRKSDSSVRQVTLAPLARLRSDQHLYTSPKSKRMEKRDPVVCRTHKYGNFVSLSVTESKNTSMKRQVDPIQTVRIFRNHYRLNLLDTVSRSNIKNIGTPPKSISIKQQPAESTRPQITPILLKKKPSTYSNIMQPFNPAFRKKSIIISPNEDFDRMCEAELSKLEITVRSTSRDSTTSIHSSKNSHKSLNIPKSKAIRVNPKGRDKNTIVSENSELANHNIESFNLMMDTTYVNCRQMITPKKSRRELGFKINGMRTKINNYVMLKSIGRGGWAEEVYLAIDTKTKIKYVGPFNPAGC